MFTRVVCVLGLYLLTLSAHAGFLSDPDGFDISLTAAGSSSNQFGPPSFTQGYDPIASAINPVPAPMPDGSEIRVEFFDTTVLISQGKTVDSPIPSTVAWTMILEDLEWSVPGEVSNVTLAFSSFPVLLATSFTASSIQIDFAGGLPMPAEAGLEFWTATLDVTVSTGPGDITTVPEPALHAILLLGLFGVWLLHRPRSFNCA